MQLVSLQSVSRHYGRIFAVHRVSLDLRAGEITALVGDNGSGKTTLLSLIATLERPSDGTIEYDDLAWETFAQHYREKIGWIAHDSLIYEELTGRENLTFYADMYGREEPEVEARDWLERVGLEEAGDRVAATYSRGMQQRLSIARALLHDPDLLLLDEPLSGLDRRGREAVVELLDSMRRRQKIVVVASHALEALGRLADRIAVLRRGKLSQIASIDAIEDTAGLYREFA